MKDVSMCYVLDVTHFFGGGSVTADTESSSQCNQSQSSLRNVTFSSRKTQFSAITIQTADHMIEASEFPENKKEIEIIFVNHEQMTYESRCSN